MIVILMQKSVQYRLMDGNIKKEKALKENDDLIKNLRKIIDTIYESDNFSRIEQKIH